MSIFTSAASATRAAALCVFSARQVMKSSASQNATSWGPIPPAVRGKAVRAQITQGPDVVRAPGHATCAGAKTPPPAIAWLATANDTVTAGRVVPEVAARMMFLLSLRLSPTLPGGFVRTPRPPWPRRLRLAEAHC